MSISETDSRRDSIRDGLSMNTVRFVSFWLAIWMPILYVPLLLNGLETAVELLTFLLLVVLNLAVLIAGHSYQPQ